MMPTSPDYEDDDEDGNRRRTRVACHGCHKAKSACGTQRPCARCVRLGRADKCEDRPRRKRRRRTQPVDPVEAEKKSKTEQGEVSATTMMRNANALWTKLRSFADNRTWAAVPSGSSPFDLPIPMFRIQSCPDSGRLQCSTNSEWIRVLGWTADELIQMVLSPPFSPTSATSMFAGPYIKPDLSAMESVQGQGTTRMECMVKLNRRLAPEVEAFVLNGRFDHHASGRLDSATICLTTVAAKPQPQQSQQQ